MLLPSEEEHMLAALRERNIPLRAMKVNPKRTLSVTPALQALLSKSKDMKVRPQHSSHTAHIVIGHYCLPK